MNSALLTMESSYTYLGLILLVAVLLHTAAVAVTFLYFNHTLNTVKQAFSTSSTSCLMGMQMKIDTEEKYDPCWQIIEQLQQRIEKTVSHLFKTKITSAARGNFEWMPSTADESYELGHHEGIAAHLTATFWTKQERDAGRPPSHTKVQGQKIEAWESQRGLAFHNNLDMRNGELIFPHTGLYYIYSQTYFRLSLQELENTEEQTRNGQVLQYIYKKMNSYPVPLLLMKNARTTCWSRDQEYGLYSIYQAGVIPLSAGDRVFVTVSNISSLDMDERSSFFGAFLVT